MLTVVLEVNLQYSLVFILRKMQQGCAFINGHTSVMLEISAPGHCAVALHCQRQGINTFIKLRLISVSPELLLTRPWVTSGLWPETKELVFSIVVSTAHSLTELLRQDGSQPVLADILGNLPSNFGIPKLS